MSHITRRELLKRGALTSAAVVWATPVVQTIGMSKALAQDASPTTTTTTTTTTLPPGDTDISYIALNVECDGDHYFIKYEVDSGWESDPGNAPKCDGIFSPAGAGANGGAMGFGVTLNGDGTITIDVPSGCTVLSSASKAGQNCCAGGSGSGPLTFACSN